MHGLGSNPDTTWGATSTSHQPSDTVTDGRWVDQFLPEDIPEQLQQHVRIYFYNYDTYWKRDAVQTRLTNVGNNLLARLDSALRETDKVSLLPLFEDFKSLTKVVIRSGRGN